MKSFYLTDAGMVRDHNEDSVIIVKNSEGNYLLLLLMELVIIPGM